MATGNPFVDVALGVGQFGESIVKDIINYRNQQEEQQYQRQLQQKIFDREDSAMQRGVADAMAAGLSPLAASAANSGAIASSVTPQLEGGSRAAQAAQFAMDMATQRQNLETGAAQQSLLDAQTSAEENREKWDNYWNSQYQRLGITPNATAQERMLAMIIDTMKNGDSGTWTDNGLMLISAATGIPLKSLQGIRDGNSIPDQVVDAQDAQTEEQKRLNQANSQRAAEAFGIWDLLKETPSAGEDPARWRAAQAKRIASSVGFTVPDGMTLSDYVYDEQTGELTLLTYINGQKKAVYKKKLKVR